MTRGRTSATTPGKSRFDDIYNEPDPRAYFRRLAPLRVRDSAPRPGRLPPHPRRPGRRPRARAAPSRCSTCAARTASTPPSSITTSRSPSCTRTTPAPRRRAPHARRTHRARQGVLRLTAPRGRDPGHRPRRRRPGRPLRPGGRPARRGVRREPGAAVHRARAATRRRRRRTDHGHRRHRLHHPPHLRIPAGVRPGAALGDRVRTAHRFLPAGDHQPCRPRPGHRDGPRRPIRSGCSPARRNSATPSNRPCSPVTTPPVLRREAATTPSCTSPGPALRGRI